MSRRLPNTAALTLSTRLTQETPEARDAPFAPLPRLAELLAQVLEALAELLALLIGHLLFGHAVEVLGKENTILMHTTSTYPAKYEQLNLRAIPTMIERYNLPVGYSGHETGIPTTVAAAVLGACCVERHITMDRAMWGSDQAASLEPNGISRLVRDIRLCEQSMGDGVKRVYEEEIPVMKKLRRVGAAV